MKKVTIILLLIAGLGSLVYFAYYKWHPGPDDLRRYKGIAWAEIPGECLEYRNDVCGLFACTVEQCWCDESSAEPPILYESADVVIQNEEEAVDLVKAFLKNSDFKEYNVKFAVRLTNIFFNVFIENADYGEVTLTVAADGTILKTICGD